MSVGKIIEEVVVDLEKEGEEEAVVEAGAGIEIIGVIEIEAVVLQGQ
jgi:hypothetical protein